MIRVHRGGSSFLVHPVAFQPDAQALIFSFSSLQLKLRIDGRLLSLRIAHLQQDGPGFDLRTGQHMNSDDSCLGFGRDLANRFLGGNESADSADLSQHRTAFNGIGPHCFALHGGGRGFQSRNSNRDSSHRQDCDRAHDHLATAFLSLQLWASDIHRIVRSNERTTNQKSQLPRSNGDSPRGHFQEMTLLFGIESDCSLMDNAEHNKTVDLRGRKAWGSHAHRVC